MAGAVASQYKIKSLEGRSQGSGPQLTVNIMYKHTTHRHVGVTYNMYYIRAAITISRPVHGEKNDINAHDLWQ